MWLWIESSFNGSCLDVRVLVQHTRARQQRDELSSRPVRYT